MIKANEALFLSHAESSFPKECCGLLVNVKGKEVYVECSNVAEQSDSHFIMDPKDYLKASNSGDILAICHSHPNVSHHPSMADRYACEKSGLPWYIAAWPLGQISRTEPNGFQAPLLGREFVHGVLDCFSLCRDYYKRILDIDIPDFERPELWWEKGMNLYEDNFGSAGFVRVDEPRLHDAVLMRIRANVTNHAAVFHKPDAIIQHLYGHLSNETVFGGFWLKNTVKFLRHESML